MYRHQRILLIIVFILHSSIVLGQSLLDKPIYLDVKKQPLKKVLDGIAKQGGFSFSYKSDILNGDSLVSVKASAKPVRLILEQLFADRFEYKETQNHIIIQYPPPYWYVSGYVVDELTGEKIINASVYEKQQLVASLTNEQGYFRLKLKDKSPAIISVSKSWYGDTSVIVRPGSNESVTLRILPKSFVLDSVTVSSRSQLEKNWLANFFLSSRQRMQSLNLTKFFVDKPYQASVIPGLSTHGKMSAQVVNKFSFNMIGGYTAGVNGFEIGGVFNIVKHDVRYAHIGGVFNMTGGSVSGVQIGGVYNGILDSANGVTIAGVANTVNGNMTGVQASGVYNHTLQDIKGLQASGVINYTKRNSKGLQVAGLGNVSGKDVDGTQIAGMGNIARREVDGLQISGLFNYAKKLDGTQIGIINIADTSSGYSIGLINLIFKGYHKLSISTNEVINLNAAFKTGNKNVYSILTAGINVGTNQKAFSFGYGIGTNLAIGKVFSINPELTAQHLYPGNWDHLNLLTRAELNVSARLFKYVTIHAGPAFSVYYSNTTTFGEGYKSVIPGNNIKANQITYNTSNWVGWNAGIDFF